MNPRAAINDLLPFQGSPFGQLGYFSKRPRFVICISKITISHFRALYQVLTFLSKSIVHYIALSIYLSSTFFKFFNFLNLTSGESGIRTHAPLRTNGFQDRLVMTTSISLQFCFALFDQRKDYYTYNPLPCQQVFFIFFAFFKKTSAINKSSGVVTLIFSYFP